MLPVFTSHFYLLPPLYPDSIFVPPTAYGPVLVTTDCLGLMLASPSCRCLSPRIAYGPVLVTTGCLGQMLASPSCRCLSPWIAFGLVALGWCSSPPLCWHIAMDCLRAGLPSGWVAFGLNTCLQTLFRRACTSLNEYCLYCITGLGGRVSGAPLWISSYAQS